MKKLEVVHSSFSFCIGSFFRFYRLLDILYGLNGDTAWEGLAALDILRGNTKDYLSYATEG